MKNVVEFKSLPKFYEKEQSDIKNNTVRQLDNTADERFRLLNLGAIKKKYGIIRIINSETKTFFERQIRDISFFNGLWIITWFPLSEKSL